jgi:hypothetical protein
MKSETARVQLTRTGAILSASPDQIGALRDAFRARHCVKLRALLEPGLLHWTLSQLEAAHFRVMTHGNIGSELCMGKNVVSDMLHLLTNDSRFRHFIEEVTGCGHIGCFMGRVYRMTPGTGHTDSWHSDIVPGETRMIGMSLNLSPDEYEGGIFELRTAPDHCSLGRFRNQGLGDAIVFRLAPYLEHRVAAIRGHVPKTAFAGWFFSEPEFSALIRS